MHSTLFPLVALIVLPIGASAFTSSSTLDSRDSLRNSQRGSSVASLVLSRGGEIGKALGTGSVVSGPVKLKSYLATTKCLAGTPNLSVDQSLATARKAELGAAGVARCNLLCQRIVSLPSDDPVLDLLTADWVIEALQVAAADSGPRQPQQITGNITRTKQSLDLGIARAGTSTIERVGARFFGFPQTIEQDPSQPRCPVGEARQIGLDAKAGPSQSEYARGLKLWKRVEEAFPKNSDLAGFAADWIAAYGSSSIARGCKSWEYFLFVYRWPELAFYQEKY